MKKSLLAGLLLALFSFAGSAQDVGKVDKSVKQQIDAALTSYYTLKDALVETDSERASQKASEVLSSVNAVDEAKMTAGQKEIWAKLAAPLRLDSEHINRSKDIEHQREHFAKLSNNMYSLVASFKANSAEAYLHYCPMKKTTWLSASKEVRNPYYGSRMLECGSVRSTLKKN